jgi:hypothetical protein
LEAPLLFNGYFGATNGFTGKTANLAGLIGYDTITLGVQRVVAAYSRTFTGTLAQTNLANDNLAGLNLLATINLNTEALAWAVASIFGGTACFDV